MSNKPFGTSQSYDITLLNQYKTIVDTAMIVSKADSRGVITYVNDKFCEISGYSQEELIGSAHSIVRHPDMDSKIFVDLWKTIQSKQVWHGVIHNLRKDGSQYTVKTTITPIINSDGVISEYIALREDISDRYRKDQKLRQVLSHINSIVIMLSVKHELLFLNQEFYEVFRFANIDEFKNQHESMSDLFIHEEGYLLPIMDGVPWTTYLLKNSSQITYVKMMNKYEKIRIFEIKIQTIANRYNDMYILTLNDITEIEIVKKEALHLFKLQKEFMTNMSHEIRTPLNGIIGFADLLQDTDLSDKQQHYVNVLNKSAALLLEITNEIFTYKAIMDENSESAFSEIILLDYLLDLEKKYIVDAKSKEIEFATEINYPRQGKITIDTLALEQILVQLLNNAFKFTPPMAKITLYAILLDEDTLRIGVKDTGIGILDKELIFKSFTQADGSNTRKHGGLGLGLTIASKLANKIGSELCVESSLGKGSDFYFIISLYHSL